MRQATLSFKPAARLADRRRDGAVVATSSSAIDLGDGQAAVVVDNVPVHVSGSGSAAPVAEKEVQAYRDVIFLLSFLKNILSSLVLKPKRKARRDMTVARKVEILNFRKNHSVQATLDRYPEICKRTLQRMAKEESKLRARLHKGGGSVKRRVPLKKYFDMGEQMHQFFIRIRDAHGAVSRDLLESYALSLPEAIRKDYFSINESSRDDVWKRWRRWYGVVYRRISGVKQYVPGDHEQRIATFHQLMRSVWREHRNHVFFCGDETGVRMEDLPSVTLEHVGEKRVHIQTVGGDKAMFTVFLASRVEVLRSGELQVHLVLKRLGYMFF